MLKRKIYRTSRPYQIFKRTDVETSSVKLKLWSLRAQCFCFGFFLFFFFFLLLSKVQSSVIKLYRVRCFYKDLSCIISVCLFSLFYFFIYILSLRINKIGRANFCEIFGTEINWFSPYLNVYILMTPFLSLIYCN